MYANPSLPEAVLWTEGMLLTPQHLQQERVYWQAQMAHRFAAALPDAWGVRQLAVDTAALLGGRVSVTLLDCVLPDGSVLCYPADGRCEPLTLQLDAPGRDSTRPLCICAVVRGHGDNAAVRGHADRRYDAGTPLRATDENTGQDAQSIDRLRLRYELAAYEIDAAPPATLSACPLLQVRRNSAGQFEVAPYHPPMLRLGASAFRAPDSLAERLEQLVQSMRMKLDELGGAVDEKPGLDDSLSGAGSVLRHAARVLAGVLPPLQICATDPELHPREMYRALAIAVGAVAALAARPMPPEMRPYRHAGCLEQFSAVCLYLEEAMQGLHSDYERHRFSPFKEGFSRRLFADMQGDVIIELQPQAGQSASDCGRWLHRSSIASADLIGVVQQQRQRGASARQLSEAEARARRLPADAALFLIKNEHIHSANKEAFAAGEPLMIQGVDRHNMPEQVFLYRAKRHRHEAGHA
ncbi:MAG: type VI secretion system baseplate subunit TssK [Pseudomonadota bacterium]